MTTVSKPLVLGHQGPHKFGLLSRCGPPLRPCAFGRTDIERLKKDGGRSMFFLPYIIYGPGFPIAIMIVLLSMGYRQVHPHRSAVGNRGRRWNLRRRQRGMCAVRMWLEGRQLRCHSVELDTYLAMFYPSHGPVMGGGMHHMITLTS